MIKLTNEDIKILHKKIIDKTGGIQGIRDEALLDSAINSPFISFGGEDLYLSLIHI